MSSPTTVHMYDELKALVQAAAEREKAHKQSVAAIQKAQQETTAAREEAAEYRQQVHALQAELEKQAKAHAAERRERERKAAAQREAVQQAALEAASAAAAAERERSAAEVQLLREAAMDDVRQAHRAARQELDAAAQSWDAQEEAHREMARLRSAKHAARLREVIASEEACQAECAALRKRIVDMAWSTVSLGVRTTRAEREASSAAVELCALRDEIATLECEAAEGEAERVELSEASAEAAAEAEEQLERLREDLRAVASKQRQHRKALAAKHEREVQSRMEEATNRAVQAAQLAHDAELAAREASHQYEVRRLREALIAAEARERQHKMEVMAMNELLGESLS